MGPKSNHKRPYKSGAQGAWTVEEKVAVVTEAKIEVMWLPAKEHPQPPETGRGKERILPEALQKEPDLQVSFRPSDLQSCKRINMLF